MAGFYRNDLKSWIFNLTAHKTCIYKNSMTLTAILTEDSDGGYVALNPETGTTTQGDNIQEALANLKEATELYLEEFPVPPRVPSLMTTFDVAYA
jgi:predicted RNase H-like HicB family nuclease